MEKSIQSRYFLSRPIKADGEEKNSISIWHDDKEIRESITKMSDEDPIWIGVVNFRNNVGFSDFVIKTANESITITIEVFPSKISYRTDYEQIKADVTEEIYNLIFDFLSKTYLIYNQGERKRNSGVEFFAIIKKIFGKLLSSIDRVITQPYHTLETTHEIMPNYKVKRTDKASIKWIIKHGGGVPPSQQGYEIPKINAIKKTINYDNYNNRFVKSAIIGIIKKLKIFKDSCRSVQSISGEVSGMINHLKGRVSNSFLSEVQQVNTTMETTLVLAMAPGYRDVY